MATQTLQVSFQLPVVTEKDGDYVVSSCPVLDVYSQGKNEDEALDNLMEALQLFIETCFEMGTLTQVLKDCGFKLTTKKRHKVQANHRYLDVPVSLITSMKNAQAYAH